MKKRKCGKPIRKAKNGADRGVCMRKPEHNGHCSSRTCLYCGIQFTKGNSVSNGFCKDCNREQSRDWKRKHLGYQPMNRQTPGEFHTFPCGCSGVLPQERGTSNQFAIKVLKQGWACRVTAVLGGIRKQSERDGYKPIDLNTPHSVIRKMMQEKNCALCGEPLKWELGRGKTPHLHHDHDTGQPIGFSHHRCNPRALESRVRELETEVAFLRAA
jgi:hypothetical protein